MRVELDAEVPPDLPRQALAQLRAGLRPFAGYEETNDSSLLVPPEITTEIGRCEFAHTQRLDQQYSEDDCVLGLSSRPPRLGHLLEFKRLAPERLGQALEIAQHALVVECSKPLSGLPREAALRLRHARGKLPYPREVRVG